ncbi:MAG: NUDIX hydrolase [Oscillospiraceae bacterium]|nr:NUDIX hydrolase [Oscillospiraceae bacterium]
MEKLAEKTVSSQLIFDGKILHLYRDDIALPNGKPAEREVIRHIGAVCVIPVTDDGCAVMERQYRYPVAEVILEIPAGKLDSRDEDHEAAARRELEEETGYRAEQMIPLGKFYPACAYSDEAIWMYLAKGLTRGDRHPDEDEFLDVELIPLKDLVRQVLDGQIPDAKTQIAVLKAAIHEGVL